MLLTHIHPGQMRILFTIPHFFKQQEKGRYGSLIMGPQLRCEAFTQCLTALRTTYGGPQFIIEVGERRAKRTHSDDEHHIDIVVCTTKDFHLLPHLNLPPSFFVHHDTDIDPMLLGFRCQALLRKNLGNYDYYCYLEDDLILHDPWLFIKLQWFTNLLGSGHLLQPNRYEASALCDSKKAYVDGDLKPEATQEFQTIQDSPQIQGSVMGKAIFFQRAANPHSGCYFLNNEQMQQWASMPYFLDGDTSFIGPLESAATLGIAKTFKVYKPSIANASFLEIQHFGQGFLQKISLKELKN